MSVVLVMPAISGDDESGSMLPKMLYAAGDGDIGAGDDADDDADDDHDDGDADVPTRMLLLTVPRTEGDLPSSEGP